MATGNKSFPQGSERQSLRVRFDSFQLDEQNARLSNNNRPVALAPKAFAVLCTLVRAQGNLVTKDALLDAVWGHQHVSESVLKTIVSELREALNDDAKAPRWIETVTRRGYRFIAVVDASQKVVPAIVAEEITQPSTFLVGRDKAQAQLRQAWHRAQNGQRQIVWVVGEAGIGKSTLIDSFSSIIGSNICIRGQCVEQHGAGEPYLPVLEALGALCRTDANLPPLLRAVAPTWLLQLPWLSDEAERASLRRELASVGQERMLREFGELIERYTQDRPLLLVTEDLHWSDDATVHLINHLARRRSPARLMWLASFRLAEVIAEDTTLKSLRHELRLHRLCEEIALESFSEQEVADFVSHRFPRNMVSESFVRALHSRTDGLPLFLRSVLDELEEQGKVPIDGEAGAEQALARTQVPENLAAVIEKQASRLPMEVHTMLQAASVCGLEFQPMILAQVLDRDIGWVSASCDELTRRQQWLASAEVSRLADGSLDARYAFRHALYRRVFYQGLGSMARAQWHARVAGALERNREAGVVVAAAELASHCELSFEWMKALHYYAEAAQNAMRHFAPKEAFTLAQHGVSLLDRCPASSQRDNVELALQAMRGAAAAQYLGVSSMEAKRAFERASAMLGSESRHPLRGLILHALGIVYLVRGEYAQTLDLGQRMHGLSTRDGDPMLLLSASSVLGQMHALQGRNEEACTWLEQGISTCQQVGDDVLHANFVVDPAVTIYAAVSIPLLHRGRMACAQQHLDTATHRARRLGEPMAEMVACWFAALFHTRLGNPAQVAAMADRMARVSQEAALAQGRAPSLWYAGWAKAHLGEPREGFRLIRMGYEHNAGLGMYCGASEVVTYAAEALVLAGDWDGASAQLEEAMQLADRFEELVYLPQMWTLKGRIARATGDAPGARTAFLKAADRARQNQALWMELTALTALCELERPPPEDFHRLGRVQAQLIEAADTSLYQRASLLLKDKL